MSISDGFVETNNLSYSDLIGLIFSSRWKSCVGRNKQEMRAHAWFGNLEYMIQMALASDFSTCGCQIRETPSNEFVQQQPLGFFNQGEPNQKWIVPTINAHCLSKEAGQNSIKTRCFECPRPSPTGDRKLSADCAIMWVHYLIYQSLPYVLATSQRWAINLLAIIHT